jgi:hypothetical protein
LSTKGPTPKPVEARPRVRRGGQHLFYEVRLSDDGAGYELGLASPDGPLLTERFDSEEALSRRFTELQAALVREGWGPMERRPTVSALDDPLGKRDASLLQLS